VPYAEPERMRRHLPQTLRALGAGLSVGVFVSLLFVSGLLETLELKALDMRFRHHAGRLSPAGDIVIVTIDQNSIDYLKHRMDILWKWPRDVYAHVIRYASGGGAKAIFMDLDISDPDINRAEFEEGETDLVLGRAMAEAGNVITAALFYGKPRKSLYGVERTGRDLLVAHSLEFEGKERLDLPENSSVVPPIDPVLANSGGVGATNIYADRDGIFRKARLFQKYGGKTYPSCPLALVLSVPGYGDMRINEDLTMRLGPHNIRLDSAGETYINWYGPGGPLGGTYKYLPIADVLLSSLQAEEGLGPVIPPGEFRDKIVLIGSNAPSLYDLKTTPFSGSGPYPGVEIAATVINNLLDGNTLGRTGKAGVILLIFAVCVLTSIPVSLTKSPLRGVAATLALMAAAYAYAIVQFYNNTFLSVVPLEGGIILSFMAVTIMNYLTEGREKRWLKKAFSQYISTSVMEELIEHPEKLKLGGEKSDLTILFSDIRGFTSISEKLDPSMLTNVLNEYLTPMTDIVFRYKGTLDKYVGDALMAFFGAPLRLRDHPAAACRAALGMMEELHRLRAKWKEAGMPRFVQLMNVGIGINSGPVSVGNMGSVSRFDYTVIGDNVNLSSRLEGSTKLYGVNILVSENTYRQTREDFVFREVDNIKVVGKDIPVKIYELIKGREGGEEEERIIEAVEGFAEGLGLYRQMRWEEAERVFGSIHPKPDKLCALYIDRCRRLKHANLPSDWDGVFERRKK
jgi:adenylate cyclase